jgi:hypothetical protein
MKNCYNFPRFPVDKAVSMVFFGQMTTILSRPIGRLQTKEVSQLYNKNNDSNNGQNNELEECVTT